jgi:F0F1-type ATP synthase assembly protein I
MEPDKKPSSGARNQYAINLTMAGLAGLVGLVVVGIVIVSLAGGLWLDRTFGTKPLFIILLVVAAGPISLYAVYRITTAAISRIKPVLPPTPGAGWNKTNEGGDDE